MTDLEISKALAMAIGWKQVLTSTAADTCYVKFGLEKTWRAFDFRSPDVIWPIAKRMGFPDRGNDGLWSVSWWGPSADTPEKAVAMAVIGGAQ